MGNYKSDYELEKRAKVLLYWALVLTVLFVLCLIGLSIELSRGVSF